jgi:NAD(P)-dependent dehydrogenase (short-subunit alcohol dehydrogenase family)
LAASWTTTLCLFLNAPFSVEENTMKNFTGAVAVVTGAGSGIGRAIALQLAREGATVHCVDLNKDAADAVARECRNGLPHCVDVTDADAVRELAETICADGGRVDILVNNAGVAHAGKIIDCEIEDWRRLLDVNVMGVVHGIHAFLPRMLEQKTPGHIVNTASGAGLFANPGMGPYCASKHAIVGLSQVLAAELHDSPIDVTILCPGIVNTSIIQASQFRGHAQGRKEKTIAFYEKRAATPDRIATDLLKAMRKGKLFCITRRLEVGLGWYLHRLSPRLSLAASRRMMKMLD